MKNSFIIILCMALLVALLGPIPSSGQRGGDHSGGGRVGSGSITIADIANKVRRFLAYMRHVGQVSIELPGKTVVVQYEIFEQLYEKGISIREIPLVDKSDESKLQIVIHELLKLAQIPDPSLELSRRLALYTVIYETSISHEFNFTPGMLLWKWEMSSTDEFMMNVQFFVKVMKRNPVVVAHTPLSRSTVVVKYTDIQKVYDRGIKVFLDDEKNLYVEGHKVDLINIPLYNQVRLDPKRWSREHVTRLKMQITIHELLGLAGIPDPFYEVSEHLTSVALDSVFLRSNILWKD